MDACGGMFGPLILSNASSPVNPTTTLPKLTPQGSLILVASKLKLGATNTLEPSSKMNRMSSLSQPRQSTAVSGQASSNAQQRYIDKKAEYEGVSALNSVSELMVQQLEDIANRTDLMADGGVAIGSVLANWPNVWRIIGLAASSGQSQEPTEETNHVDDTGAETVPRLVRIGVNDNAAAPTPEP